MSQYNFFCLCLDHNGKHLGNIFEVEISQHASVSKLQLAIKAQKALVTAHLEADQLRLWKLSTPVPAGGTRAERNETLKAIKFPDPDSVEAFKGNDSVQFLQPSGTLSDYWEKPPERKHIHILVHLPPPGPPKHCPSWLVELYAKLWGKWGKLGHNIFRTANLTNQDFQDLQALLDTKNPGRTSDLYEPQDVLAIKAGFLHVRSQPLKLKLGNGLVPRFVDVTQVPSSNNGDANNAAVDIDSNDLLPETKEIFPCTIRYVDLTGLVLKNDIRVPLLMLLRNEWDTMIDIFNKIKIEGVNGSAVFTGQPGIGKTCLLHAILIHRMLHQQQFVFQDMEGNVYVIDSTGINTLEPSKVFDCEVLGLVDADGDRCQPTEGLLSAGRCRILLTSSPRQYSDRKWLKQRASTLHVYIMELWSRKEFFVASLFLHNRDITLKQLQEVSYICGNIPRPCYEAVEYNGALDDTKQKMRKAIQNIKELHDTVLYLPDKSEITHRVFQVRPQPSKPRYSDYYLVQPVSGWAFSEILKELPNRYMAEARKMYYAIRGSPDAATLRGQIFENYLHHFMEHSRTFNIKSLNDPSATLSFNTTPGLIHLIFTNDRFSHHLASSVQSNRPRYLRPQSRNFPSFDSFLYLPGIPGFSPLIALQVTIAAMHDIKITGLKTVQDALKVHALNDLEPTQTKKMIILFVVPKTSENTFKVQKIVGDGAENWYAKTAQYVVALDEEELFNVNKT